MSNSAKGALRWLWRFALILLGWMLLAQVALRLLRRHRHFPAPASVSVLLNSRLRRLLQPPDRIVGRLRIRPGMTVLEAGPGPGTFTFEAARRAYPGGQVIAVDIQPQMLARLRARLEGEAIDNVAPKLADVRYLPLPDDSVDRALMVTVLAETPDPVRALTEIRRVLRPNGLLSVSEFAIDPDFRWQSTVIRWAEGAGFRLVARYGTPLNYTLNFVPLKGQDRPTPPAPHPR